MSSTTSCEIVDSVLHPLVETPVEPCVVSVSQVDIVLDRAVEPSSTSDIYVVFVGASVNEPTKLIFYNPNDSVVEPDVRTSRVQLENVVKPFSENDVDLYGPY
jgi:hypothetical protein